jgi:isochorismate hydrolase
MPGLAMDAAPVKRAIVEEAVPEADEAVLVELWQTPLLQETAT